MLATPSIGHVMAHGISHISIPYHRHHTHSYQVIPNASHYTIPHLFGPGRNGRSARSVHPRSGARFSSVCNLGQLFLPPDGRVPVIPLVCPVLHIRQSMMWLDSVFSTEILGSPHSAYPDLSPTTFSLFRV